MAAGLTYSLNEITATARKAARGAGLDDGSAQDCAAAAARAIAAGRPGLTWLVAALDDLPSLRAALSAADLHLAGEPVDAPATPLFPYLLDTDDAPRHGAFDIDAETWAAALTLAHRTYVPASDASRLAGAGAGTTDND